MSYSDHPVFPGPIDDPTDKRMGLNKREYFAGLAMQSFLSTPEWWSAIFINHGGNYDWEHIAQSSIGMADALIEELSKQK